MTGQCRCSIEPRSKGSLRPFMFWESCYGVMEMTPKQSNILSAQPLWDFKLPLQTSALHTAIWFICPQSGASLRMVVPSHLARVCGGFKKVLGKVAEQAAQSHEQIRAVGGERQI